MISFNLMSMKGLLQKRLKNQRGQMAVFVALTFQILFVLFAMIVNVGLIVFQKINLQNAVDLAAFYAAQRQAEILNVIAHENFQIRQAYKLLAWRYRVMGASGLDLHPGNRNNHVLSGVPDAPADKYLATILNVPQVCVHNPDWRYVTTNESFCRGFERIPIFPPFKVIFDMGGLQAATAQFFSNSIRSISNTCNGAGLPNWRFAAGIWYAFRADAAKHKEVIQWMAQTLHSADDFRDIHGQSVKQGAQNTFVKNLSKPNGQQASSIELFNSLGSLDLESWLPEIPINMTLSYVDLYERDGCTKEFRDVSLAPQGRALDNDGDRYLLALAKGEPRSNLRSSLGYEKNPWAMAYVGAKATVQTRSVFHPFGQTTSMTARAFAQPFGGRIGPWMQEIWPRGSPQSAGPYTDPLVPMRFTDPKPSADSKASWERYYPNFSRYVGDKLGLNSQVALVGLPADIKTRTQAFSLDDIVDVLAGDWKDNDALSWQKDPPPFKPAVVRPYEIAAIAPNLFDVAYYSIDPTFRYNYYNALDSRPDKPTGVIVRLDYGGRLNGDPKLGVYQVQDQIFDGVNLTRTINQFWLIRDKSHLLTDWVVDALFTYTFPLRTFGQCIFSAVEEAPTPGGCAVGGRTGYSVRLISKSYLISEKHQLGGRGVGPASILNPPPEGF